MPEWITGLFAGVMILLATQFLQNFFKRVQYRDEKLLNLYADFVGALSSDWDRAKSVDSMIALGGANDNEGAVAEFRKLEEKRHELRKELSRLAFLIRMLEKDETLRRMVDLISKAQPFMSYAFPPKHGKGNYNEWSATYRSAIDSFGASMENLVDAIQNRHTHIRNMFPEIPQ